MKPPFKLLWVSLVVIAPASARCGELQQEFQKAHPGYSFSEKSRTNEEVEAAVPGITEVGLERTPGYCGDCPVYTVLIKADGSFTYTGGKNTKHTGRHTGHLPDADVTALFQYIRDIDFFALENNYSMLATDQDEFFTSVTKAGQRKIVRNYGSAGPTKLWALEQLIEALLAKASWDQSR